MGSTLALPDFGTNFAILLSTPDSDRAAIPVGRGTYIVFPLGTDCDTPYCQLAPKSELST